MNVGEVADILVASVRLKGECRHQAVERLTTMLGAERSAFVGGLMWACATGRVVLSDDGLTLTPGPELGELTSTDKERLASLWATVQTRVFDDAYTIGAYEAAATGGETITF